MSCVMQKMIILQLTYAVSVEYRRAALKYFVMLNGDELNVHGGQIYTNEQLDKKLSCH